MSLAAEQTKLQEISTRRTIIRREPDTPARQAALDALDAEERVVRAKFSGEPIIVPGDAEPSAQADEPAAEPATPRQHAARKGYDWAAGESWHDFYKRDWSQAFECVVFIDSRAAMTRADAGANNDDLQVRCGRWYKRLAACIDADGRYTPPAPQSATPLAAAASQPRATAAEPSKSLAKFEEVIGRMVPVAEVCEPCSSHRRGKMTGVWKYLQAKGLDPALVPDSIQRCGNVYPPAGALVGVATDESGTPRALGLVMLTINGEVSKRFGDGSGKLTLSHDKGWFKSGAVVRMPARDRNAAAPIILAEGVCTALALWQALDNAEVWAVLGVQRIGLVPVPPERELIIAADHDYKDGDGAKRLKHAIQQRRAKRSFKLTMPPEEGTDFCDLYVAQGAATVRAAISGAEVVEQQQRGSTVTPAGSWPGGLNQFGNVIPNLRNTEEAIEQLALECKYNEFNNRYIVHGHAIEALGGDLTDDAVRAVRMAIAKGFGFEPQKETLHDVIALACRAHTFHPILDSLAELPAWDNTPRINTWLIDYLGAPDTPLVRAYSRKTMCALIRRIKQPGCKFDHVLTLTGKQDIGKTLLCGDLAGSDEYYADVGIIADNPREAMEQFAGKWVIEIGELAGYTSHTRERIKAFITKRFERARGVWKHFAENYPRAFIFIATVNPGGFLNDPTGERRWWIVEVKFYNRDAFLRDRDQLLAEALLAEPNEKLYLDTDELREAQASMAYDYKEPNELADVLAELKGYPFKRTEDGKLEERISNAAVRRFLDVEAKDLVRSGVRNLSASIANAMAHLGWRKATRTLTMEPGRAPERGYCRPVDTAKMPARDDAVPLGLGPRQPDIPGLAPPDAVQDYGADAAEVPVD